jgi:hypothetical protein
MLTRSELIVAAKRARTYPVGHGRVWGYGPLQSAGAGTLTAAEYLEAEPGWVRYG